MPCRHAMIREQDRQHHGISIENVVEKPLIDAISLGLEARPNSRVEFDDDEYPNTVGGDAQNASSLPQEAVATYVASHLSSYPAACASQLLSSPHLEMLEALLAQNYNHTTVPALTHQHHRESGARASAEKVPVAK
jgi:hypothetical protein